MQFKVDSKSNQKSFNRPSRLEINEIFTVEGSVQIQTTDFIRHLQDLTKINRAQLTNIIEAEGKLSKHLFEVFKLEEELDASICALNKEKHLTEKNDSSNLSNIRKIAQEASSIPIFIQEQVSSKKYQTAQKLQSQKINHLESIIEEQTRDESFLKEMRRGGDENEQNYQNSFF